jgi:hypothetical protein
MISPHFGLLGVFWHVLKVCSHCYGAFEEAVYGPNLSLKAALVLPGIIN